MWPRLGRLAAKQSRMFQTNKKARQFALAGLFEFWLRTRQA